MPLFSFLIHLFGPARKKYCQRPFLKGESLLRRKASSSIRLAVVLISFPNSGPAADMRCILKAFHPWQSEIKHNPNTDAVSQRSQTVAFTACDDFAAHFTSNSAPQTELTLRWRTAMVVAPAPAPRLNMFLVADRCMWIVNSNLRPLTKGYL